MRYANSLKYINNLDKAPSNTLLSGKRVRELCADLVKVNKKFKAVWLPFGSAGHATAVMIESVLKSAGYKVGRITPFFGTDLREFLHIDGIRTGIEDYNKAVEDLKRVIGKRKQKDCFKEEALFLLSLIVCSTQRCDYVIFEGTSGEGFSLDSVCAPYELVILPSIHSESGEDKCVDVVCEAINRGAGEMVSGNQRGSVYTRISSACVNNGMRLDLTAKPTFLIQDISSMNLKFSYSGVDGYMLKSPSLLLRECAMLVIESALAIRRMGAQISTEDIIVGIGSAKDTGCFDVISMSPFIVFDTAETQSELKMLLDTSDQVLGKTSGAVLCTTAYDRKGLEEKLGAFVERELSEVVICGAFEGMEEFISEKGIKNITICKNAAEAAKAIHSMSSNESMMICCGEMSFTKELKLEFLRRMGY